MAPQSTAVPPPPPLFLTKRVTAFLRANLSEHLRAAVLTTPAGNLLVHASTLPASVLRRQCAVAASLWALQHPPSTSDDASGSSSPVPSSSTASLRSTGTVPAVTIQLDTGVVFVIRQLHCGMLFICMGGDEPLKTPTQSIVNGGGGGGGGASSTSLASQEAGQDIGGGGASADAAMSPSSSIPLASPSQESTAPSSVAAAAAGGLSPANVRALRRQVEELARWLDARLGALNVPEAGIGGSAGP